MSDRIDRRSPEAAAYRKLYKSKRWKACREAQLARQPLCERHLRRGQTIAATVVNHRRPHRGDTHLFFDPANHESSCKPCHDGPIQRDEAAGCISAEVDDDGWPTDPRHRALRPAGAPRPAG